MSYTPQILVILAGFGPASSRLGGGCISALPEDENFRATTDSTVPSDQTGPAPVVAGEIVGSLAEI